MAPPENRLIPFILDAARSRERRQDILRAFVWAMVITPLPLPSDPRYYIFANLRHDAALYEPDPLRYRSGQVTDDRMEVLLRKAVEDLRAAGFPAEFPLATGESTAGVEEVESPADLLVPMVLAALRNPERRRDILREFVKAVDLAPLPLLRDRRYYIISNLQVDATLYVQNVMGPSQPVFDDRRMEERLRGAVADLRSVGFRVEEAP
jgi:hypothetical protein